MKLISFWLSNQKNQLQRYISNFSTTLHMYNTERERGGGIWWTCRNRRQILHVERERKTERSGGDRQTDRNEGRVSFYFINHLHKCLNFMLCIYFCRNSFLDRYWDLLLFPIRVYTTDKFTFKRPPTKENLECPLYWYMYIILYTIISTGNYIVCFQNMIYCILVYHEFYASYYFSYNDLLFWEEGTLLFSIRN